MITVGEWKCFFYHNLFDVYFCRGFFCENVYCLIQDLYLIASYWWMEYHFNRIDCLDSQKTDSSSGSTISTLLHDKINPKDCQVASPLVIQDFSNFYRGPVVWDQP